MGNDRKVPYLNLNCKLKQHIIDPCLENYNGVLLV